VKIAIMTGLLAKRNMEINTGHNWEEYLITRTR